MNRDDLSASDLKHLTTLVAWAESGVDKYGLEEDEDIISALLHLGPVANPDFDYRKFLGLEDDLTPENH